MFFFEHCHELDPLNIGHNISTIKRIEWRDTKYIHGFEMEKSPDEDFYEVKITLMDDSFKTFMINEERDLNFFFKQLRRLGLEE